MKTPIRYIRLFAELLKRGPSGLTRWKDKSGFSPSSNRPSVVFHCHDIGEVKTLLPFLSVLNMEALSLDTVVWVYSKDAYRYMNSAKPFPAGRVCYSPYYDPECVKRSLLRLDARCLVIMESDFSPDYIETAQQMGLPTIALNLSFLHWRDRDLHGYTDLRFREMLTRMTLVTFKNNSVRHLLFENATVPGHLELTGNLRYLSDGTDAELPPSPLKTLLTNARKESFVLVAGSTYENEEELLLKGLKEFFSGGKFHLILAPRKPWKSPNTVRLAASHGFTVARRSSLEGSSRLPAVLVLDTMGELSHLYGLTHAAFVGGTIRNKGGHNFFEPAKFGIPMMFGPHFQNNIDLAADLLDSGGGFRVRNEEEIRQCVARWVSDEKTRAEDGNRVKDCIHSQNERLGRIQKRFIEVLEAIR